MDNKPQRAISKWKPIEIMLALLFLVAPFYFQNNLGGRGLELPFNFGIWLTISFIIFFAIWKMVNVGKISLPNTYIAFLAFPILIVISGLLAGIISPMEWYFRQLFIFIGVMFLFALFQYEKPKEPDRILLILAVSSIPHTAIALLQINNSSFMTGWYPQNYIGIPTGIFQQVNVNASYLVTCILAAFYLQGRQYFIGLSLPYKYIVLLAIGLGSYTVFATASRIGLLTLAVGLVFLCTAYFKRYRKQYKLVLLSFFIVLVAGTIAKDGIDKTMDKSARLVEQQYSDARWSIYAISLETVKQSPLYGHGIGGFLKAWSDEIAEFHRENEQASLPQYITHPHNEVLFWLIEGGILAILGISIALTSVLVVIYRLGFQEGGAYLALLVPIGLHTQVELPFYLSSLHWFVFLFIIYLILSHYSVNKDLSLSNPARMLIKIVSVIALTLGNYSIVDTAKAQNDIYEFVNQTAQPPYLNIALSNLYSVAYAEKLAMRSELYNAISLKDGVTIKKYLLWAENYVKLRPELKIYEDILNAYIALNDMKSNCKVVDDAIAIYPQNDALKKLNSDCVYLR
ncbi:MAG: Wzy polymerase domain-containing protein [Gammaproteobacteria bacterium]|nr:Wzy polymerase domain-containing protein [Gammaproteobacteria bacterium]